MRPSVNRRLVAKKAGVSESTVSRALARSPLISAGTREKIHRVAESLAYFPNRQASLLARQRALRLGFVIPVHQSIPPFSRAYFPALLDGAVTAAEEKGYAVTIVLDKTQGQPKDLARLVRTKEVDGLLLAILKQGDPRVAELKKQSVPFVLVNAIEEGAFCVDHDPRPGMEKAFAFIAETGHRQIGFISGDMQYLNAVERLETFKALAAKHGLQYEVSTGDFSKRSGYYCAGKLLQAPAPPTLIMTSSDRQALGVLEYARDHRIAVPESLSLIGFDNLDPAGFVHPPLTTVNNPVREAGAEGTRLLIDILDGISKRPKTIRLPTGFVVRDSTRKLPIT